MQIVDIDRCSHVFEEEGSDFNLSQHSRVSESIQPELDKIRNEYLEEPEKSRSSLERLLSHRLFNKFASSYIRTIETILRDLIIDKQVNIACT